MRDERARAKMLSGLTIAMMMVAAVSGLWLLSGPAEAAAVGTEDFDDETVGDHVTSETWYEFSNQTDSGGPPSDYFNVDDTRAVSGSNSYHLNATSSHKVHVMWTFTGGGVDLQYLNFSYYKTTAGQVTVNIENATDEYTYAKLLLSETHDGNIKFHDGTNKIVVTSESLNEWITVSLGPWNYTDNTVQITVGGTSYGWFTTMNPISQNQSIDRIKWSQPLQTNDCWIDDVTVTDTTAGGNSPPSTSSPSPADGATGVSVDLSSWSCTVSDPDGDSFDWSIETAPSVGSASGTGESDGTKTCSLSGLSYATTYTVYVNVTDGTADTNDTYTFTTEGQQPSVALSGLTSGEITWNGTAGTVAWCNASGSGQETLAVAITGGSGDQDGDVTQVNLSFSDLSDGGGGTIPDTNLTVYASVDQSTWREIGSPSSHMVYLNATVWTWADDPFPISGDDTIYLRYKLALGGDAGEYTATGWTVTICNYS